MDLSVTKDGEAELSRSSVIITSVENGHTDEFIIVLEGNHLSFYTSV